MLDILSPSEYPSELARLSINLLPSLCLELLPAALFDSRCVRWDGVGVFSGRDELSGALETRSMVTD